MYRISAPENAAAAAADKNQPHQRTIYSHPAPCIQANVTPTLNTDSTGHPPRRQQSIQHNILFSHARIKGVSIGTLNKAYASIDRQLLSAHVPTNLPSYMQNTTSTLNTVSAAVDVAGSLRSSADTCTERGALRQQSSTLHGAQVPLCLHEPARSDAYRAL